METQQKPRGTGEAASGIVKKRFYAHGRHPNSLRNLKPQRKGQPSRNPWGRAGKPEPGDFQSELQELFFGRDWQRFVKQTERTQRMLVKSMAEHFKVKPKQMERELRESGLL